MSIIKERADYYVVLHDSRWKIRFGGLHFGPYRTEEDATRYAVQTAHKAGQLGFDAQVFTQGQNTRFCIEWTYATDAR